MLEYMFLKVAALRGASTLIKPMINLVEVENLLSRDLFSERERENKGN